MKQILLRFIFTLNFSTLIFNSSQAQLAFIPDTNFRNFLMTSGFAACMQGDSLDTTCTAVITANKINCANKNILNLSGIEYFDGLDSLLVNNNTNLNTISRFPDSLLYFYSYSNIHLSSIPALPATLIYLICQGDSLLVLPTLPSGLKNLTCVNNHLTSLPMLPPQLEELQCQGNLLTSLPSLPSSLLNLYCSNNLLNSLPSIPSSLLKLYCDQNELATFPILPATLKILICGSNGHPVLPASLPDSLVYFDCTNDSVTTLPIVPQGLITLNCGFNQISFLPSLPPFLGRLDCRFNQLNSIPTLPVDYLGYLDCSHNNLTSLPPMPITSDFRYLDCSYNNLSSIPQLVAGTFFTFNCSYNPNLSSLTVSYAIPFTSFNCSHCNIQYIYANYLSFDWTGGFMDCSYNSISILPSVNELISLNCSHNSFLELLLPSIAPSTPILNVDCSYNNITSLELTDTIGTLNISNNPISCMPQITKIGNFQWSNTNIHCLPNFGQITNSTPPISGLGLCQASDNCPSLWNINGMVYFDTDSNCVQNGGEIGLSNIPIILDSGGIQQQVCLTDIQGRYSFRTGFGTYTIRVDTANAAYRVVCPLSFFVTSALSSIDSLDTVPSFGLLCNSGFDLTARNITPIQMFRPGFQNTVYLNAGDGMEFSGMSCANLTGTVQAVLSGLAVYVSPAAGALTPSSISGDTIIWNVNDFSVVDPMHDFNIIVQVSPAATINDSICIQLDVFPIVGDHLPANNHLSDCFPVRGAVDPNEKYMSPSGIVDSTNEWFTFTILFQNVGNATAENIYILDTLDQNLNASTFTWLSSSHDLITQLLPGNILRFNFPGIQLPDSISNEQGSHGFVTFKIKKNENLPNGTVITNVAHIFFDYNTPVTTNEVSATLQGCLPVTADFTAPDSICPGSCISFQNLSINATYYQWYFPGAVPNTSTDANPTNICYEYGGYFPVTLIAGCLNQLDTLTRDTFITVYPIVNLGTGNQMLCPGTCTDFSAFTANATSWQWYFDGGVPPVSSDQNPLGICYSNPGSYNVTIVVAASGCSDSVVLANFVTVYPTSSVSIQQSDDTLFATIGFVSYQWYMDSILINGATNSFYVATQNGNYSVVATDQFGCDVAAEILNVMTSQQEYMTDYPISIYPNPTTGQLTVDSKPYAISSIEFRDLLGQVIYFLKADGRKKVVVNLSELPDGFYILNVNSENGQILKKILKR